MIYLIEHGPTQYTQTANSVNDCLNRVFGDSTPEGIQRFFDARAGVKPASLSVSVMSGQEAKPVLKLYF